MRRFCFFMLLLPSVALAEQLPRPGVVDPRVRSIVYNPSEVVVIRGSYGFQQMIQLADDEKVESLSIGDALAWQVTPTKGGNLLFLKPVEPKAHTNLAVVTDKRTYSFELLALNLGPQPADMNYVVRFQYPEEEQARVLAALEESQRRLAQEVTPQRRVDPSQWNLDYKVKGKDRIAPLQVFDDGNFTYFRFREQQEIPAIFLVGEEDRKESLLNYHLSGRFVVVERTGERFVLRGRDGVVQIQREAKQASVARPSVAQR